MFTRQQKNERAEDVIQNNFKIKKTTIMKTKKTATIVAMGVLAMQAAVADMKAEYGEDYIPMDGTVLSYTWDPFSGECA